MKFVVTEFKIPSVGEELAETGKTEVYMADSYAEAVLNVLYAKRISNGNAKVGPTGMVVYSLGMAYAVTVDHEIQGT